MMEFPARWIAFSVGLVVLSVALVFKLNIPLGADLKGGTRLVYSVPFSDPAETRASDGGDRQEIVRKTLDVMQKRVDGMGLREINIAQQGEDEIVVELPGLTEAEVTRIKETVTSLGKLEFRIELQEGDPNIDVNRERRKLNDWLDKAENKRLTEQWGTLEATKEAAAPRDLTFWVDMLKVYNGLRTEGGPVKGLRWYVQTEGKTFGAAGEARKTRPTFRALRIDEELNPRDKKFVFRGEDLASVNLTSDPKSGGLAVGFEIKPDRAGDFGEFTGSNLQKILAIVLNDIYDTGATLNEEISDRGQISRSSLGGYSREEATQLVTILETGSLQVRPRLESESRMGAGLGEDSIRLGALSAALALVATIAFMLLYYRLAGTIAALSLVVNGAILLGVLAVYNATLTLPGIGGFILTLAMAVDSNILIYERIREERDKGRGVEQAVRLGFERAFVTILDSNLTTLLTSMVLFWVGTGPIKGLGLTLSVGILSTLFAALVFTKACFAWLLQRKALPEVKMLRLFKTTPNLKFTKIWKLTVFISVATSIAGLAVYFSAPEKVKGIDFVGGATARVRLREPLRQIEFAQLVNTIPGFEALDATYSLSEGSVVPGKEGYREFVVKGKLDRSQRTAMKADETEKTQVDSFREGLRTALGARLLPDPVSDVKIEPGANGGPSKIAFTLSFESPIEPSVVRDILRDKAPYLAKATVAGAPESGPSSAARIALPIHAELTPGMTEQDVRLRMPTAFAAVRATTPLSDPFPEVNTIKPRAAKSLLNKAYLSLLLAFFGIILYVRFRFHEYRYGIGGVVAIIHDLIVTLGIITIANVMGLVDVEIDMTMIAVFLTIAGYSINDTIVIFDRIRENLEKPEAEKRPLDVIVDEACNQTLSRTLLTSTAAFLSSALMFFINRGKHNPLEGFGFTMMVGIASGTYSSIWVASLFVVGVERWKQLRGKRNGPQKPAPVAVATA
jgi:SecD/SecF fusion protein